MVFARAHALTPLPRRSHTHSDYGNAESNNHDDGRGTMEALNFGTKMDKLWCTGTGVGPHVMVDLENGCGAAVSRAARHSQH